MAHMLSSGFGWAIVLTGLVIILIALPVLLLTYHFETVEQAGLLAPGLTDLAALRGAGWVVLPVVQRLAPAVVPPSVTVVDRLLEATTTALRRRHGRDVAVVIIEVARPSIVGPRLGLSTVELSTLVMRRLRTGLPREHSIARLTANRFAVLAEGLPPGGAPALAAQVAQMLDAPLQGDGHAAVIGFSIGTAEATGQLNTAPALIRAAQRTHGIAVRETAADDGTHTVWRSHEASTGPTPAGVDVAALHRAIISGSLQAGFRPIATPDANTPPLGLQALPLFATESGALLTPTGFSAAARAMALAATAARGVAAQSLAAAADWHANRSSPRRLYLHLEPDLLRDPDFPAALLGSINRQGLGGLPVTVTVEAHLGGLPRDLLRPAVTQLRTQGVGVILTGWVPPLLIPANTQPGRRPAPAPPVPDVINVGLPINGLMVAAGLAQLLNSDTARLQRVVDQCHRSAMLCGFDGLTHPEQRATAGRIGADFVAGPAVGGITSAAQATERFKTATTTIYS